MTHIKHIALALVAAATLAGCSDNLSDLEAKVTEIKARPGGRIEPLPEVKPYETTQVHFQITCFPTGVQVVTTVEGLDAGMFYTIYLDEALRPEQVSCSD